MHGIGAKIDADAERVFHEPEVFIASPEQGLQVGRDLQSDLQWFRWPPMGEVDVEHRPPAVLLSQVLPGTSAEPGTGIRANRLDAAIDTEASRRTTPGIGPGIGCEKSCILKELRAARGVAEPKLWAA